jgi:chemotaxis protein MotB
MRHFHPRRAQAGHGDEWLITYADTITLLLCLFVVLLCATVARKNVVPPPPPPPIAAESHSILPSDVLEGNLPLHGVAHADRSSRDADDEDADEDAPADWIRAELPVPAPHRWRADPPAVQVASAVAPVRVALPARPALELADLPKPPPPPPPPPGERIIVLQVSSTAFFDSGSALLSDSGRAILQGVAVDLGSEKYLGYQVTVEGHTDDTPISTAQFPSNWELSTSRAAAVVRYLLDQGLPAPMLRAAGYADSFPIAPNRDAAGRPVPENQARNRRVVIKLEKIER